MEYRLPGRGPLQRRLVEQGVHLEGGIAGHSYIVLNDRGVQQLKDNSVRDGDILHIFPAMTGG